MTSVVGNTDPTNTPADENPNSTQTPVDRKSSHTKISKTVITAISVSVGVCAALLLCIYFRMKKAPRGDVNLPPVCADFPFPVERENPIHAEAPHVPPLSVVASARGYGELHQQSRENNQTSGHFPRDEKIRTENHALGERPEHAQFQGSMTYVEESSYRTDTHVASESRISGVETSNVPSSVPQDPAAIPELLQRLNMAIANLPHSTSGIQEGEGDQPPGYYAL